MIGSVKESDKLFGNLLTVLSSPTYIYVAHTVSPIAQLCYTKHDGKEVGGEKRTEFIGDYCS